VAYPSGIVITPDSPYRHRQRESLLKFDTRGEELHFHGNELYIYFWNGMCKSKLS
jgi:hypothetical protein